PRPATSCTSRPRTRRTARSSPASTTSVAADPQRRASTPNPSPRALGAPSPSLRALGGHAQPVGGPLAGDRPVFRTFCPPAAGSGAALSSCAGEGEFDVANDLVHAHPLRYPGDLPAEICQPRVDPDVSAPLSGISVMLAVVEDRDLLADVREVGDGHEFS